jgi:hypothetical protein
MKNIKHLCLCVAAVLTVGLFSGCETDDEAMTTSTTTETSAVRSAPVSSSSVESTTVRSF